MPYEDREKSAGREPTDSERYDRLLELIRSKKLVSIYKGHNRVNYCLIADDIHLTGKTMDEIIDQLP